MRFPYQYLATSAETGEISRVRDATTSAKNRQTRVCRLNILLMGSVNDAVLLLLGRTLPGEEWASNCFTLLSQMLRDSIQVFPGCAGLEQQNGVQTSEAFRYFPPYIRSMSAW